METGRQANNNVLIKNQRFFLIVKCLILRRTNIMNCLKHMQQLFTVHKSMWSKQAFLNYILNNLIQVRR